MTCGLEAEITAWLSARADRTVETAIARVFLCGGTAFKMKRHVTLGYVDFSTAERRLWALERELKFNRATSPDIYRAVRTITREASGALAFDGAGAALDHVLEMRRFDEGAVLSNQPQAVDGAMAESLGRTIAGIHAKAELRPKGGLSSMAFTVGSNAQLLREAADRLGADDVERLIELTEAEFERQAALMAHRTAAGFSRLCHGDLHLGNILVEDGRPVLFDCIEFNDLLSDIDVLYDLAFLLMDLDFRGRRDAGVRVLSAYLDEAARSFADELWDGLVALPLMLSIRAAVRAHVCAHSNDDGTARAYVAAAIAHLSPPPPLLAAVGGLSGSGKSTFARAVAPRLGASPGAVVLRTDEVRKRLFGARPDQALPAEAYGAEATRRTYDALFETAARLLSARRAVVLDATFLDPALRARAAAVASAAGAPFRSAWMDAPVEVLAQRIAGRCGDASDATVQTLRDQLARGAAPADWRRVDATAATEAAAEAWRLA